MKILEVNKLYSPWVGGVEKVAQDIAEGLQSDDYKFEVLVCQPKGKAIDDEVNNIPVYRASSLGMFLGMPVSLDFFRKYKKLSKDADVILLHHPFPLGFLAYLLFGRKKRMMVWYHSDILRQKLTGFLFKPFIKATLSQAERILVASQGLIDNSKVLNAHKDKCSIIPFGEDLAIFSDPSAYAADVEAIHGQFMGKLVLAVGRLVPYKGFSYLIDAMKDVDARLIIVGDGPLKDELSAQAKSLGIEDKVNIIGNVQNLAPYYFACDVFVLPSVMATEAFGLVQIEAMSAGKPVINTSLPTGVPEVSLNGKTGITVPPRDTKALKKALNRLLTNMELRNEFGQAAKKRADEEFSLEMFKKRLKEVLRG